MKALAKTTFWRAFALSLIGAIMMSGCSAPAPSRDEDGQVTEAGTSSFAKVSIGDCFVDSTVDLESGEQQGELVVDEAMTVVPCSEPHVAQAFAKGELSGSEYPSADELETQISNVCDKPFANFVNAGAEGTDIAYTAYYPQGLSFSRGDRLMLCAVIPADTTKLLTKDAKGAKSEAELGLVDLQSVGK
ncbi:hypothetical protein AQ436_15740 [Arthrobacter sp. EpRS66]|nr:hypothetical protein AQ436_15740 [Arthrobacter sp. EpRS66]